MQVQALGYLGFSAKDIDEWKKARASAARTRDVEQP